MLLILSTLTFRFDEFLTSLLVVSGKSAVAILDIFTGYIYNSNCLIKASSGQGYNIKALVHFRTLVTLRRVRVRVKVGLELRLGLELGLGSGWG